VTATHHQWPPPQLGFESVHQFVPPPDQPHESQTDKGTEDPEDHRVRHQDPEVAFVCTSDGAGGIAGAGLGGALTDESLTV